MHTAHVVHGPVASRSTDQPGSQFITSSVQLQHGVFIYQMADPILKASQSRQASAIEFLKTDEKYLTPELLSLAFFVLHGLMLHA